MEEVDPLSAEPADRVEDFPVLTRGTSAKARPEAWDATDVDSSRSGSFDVADDQCGMKVGTDALVLGCWAGENWTVGRG